jgi:hypothetical protein
MMTNRLVTAPTETDDPVNYLSELTPDELIEFIRQPAQVIAGLQLMNDQWHYAMALVAATKLELALED